MKESKRTHRFSVTLSFVLSDERLGAKLRVTENRCILFDSFIYIYIYIYIYINEREREGERGRERITLCQRIE